MLALMKSDTVDTHASKDTRIDFQIVDGQTDLQMDALALNEQLCLTHHKWAQQ